MISQDCQLQVRISWLNLLPLPMVFTPDMFLFNLAKQKDLYIHRNQLLKQLMKDSSVS
jgi:hypothetical protein